MSYALALGEDYSAIVGAGLKAELPSSPEGDLASHVLSAAAGGPALDVGAEARTAGSIVGGSIGAGAGPVGAAVGSIVGSAVAGAVAGMFGGGDGGGDAALKATNLATPSLCSIRGSNGLIATSCKDAVYGAYADRIINWNVCQPSGWSGATLGTCTHRGDVQAWGAHFGIPVPASGPISTDTLDRITAARLAEAAATRRLQDDIVWGKHVVQLANQTSQQWAPKCPSSGPYHAPCVSQVKGAATNYALSAFPFRQDGSPIVQFIAGGGIDQTMQGIVTGAQAGSSTAVSVSNAQANQANQAAVQGLAAIAHAKRMKILAIGAFGVIVAGAIAYVAVD